MVHKIKKELILDKNYITRLNDNDCKGIGIKM